MAGARGLLGLQAVARRTKARLSLKMEPGDTAYFYSSSLGKMGTGNEIPRRCPDF